MIRKTREHLTNEPYPYVLDSKPGFFLGWLLYKLFSRVKYRPEMREQLRKLGRQGVIVYAIKHRGALDYLLYHYRFLGDRIPYPRIAFDLNMILWLPLRRAFGIAGYYIGNWLRGRKPDDPYTSGYFREKVKLGTTSLLFLVDEKGFSRRFMHSIEHPIVMLMKIQKELDRPIFLVPLTYVYELKPEKQKLSLLDLFFGSKDNPGTFRKVVLFFRYFRRAFIDVGPFVNLGEHLPQEWSPETVREAGRDLCDKLLDHIDRQRRVVLGPQLKTRQQFRELVLDDLEMRQDLETTAAERNKSVKNIRKQAAAYFDEIAANYNAVYVHLWDYVLTFIFERIFEGVEVDEEGLSRVREAARRGTMIYVPCHRSHIDYLVLNYILFKHQLHTPRVAAGKNLSFWPMGHIFRNSGAFFLRRTFRNMPLYEKVFTKYVQTLIEYEYPLEFFIEGGRSRSGKMIMPKFGLLSIALDTLAKERCDDLMFVPAHIGYDQIMEEQYYVRELGGTEKKKESLFQVIKARKFLRRRYGTVYIRFAEPISARSYFSEQSSEVFENPDLKREAYRGFSFHLIHSINNVTTVTPLSLVVTAISAIPYRGFSCVEISKIARMYVDYLSHIGAPLQETVLDPAKCVRTVLSMLEERGKIDYLEGEDPGDEEFYLIDDDKRISLEYYKNNAIHHFVPAAFISLSLLSKESLTASKAELDADVEFLGETLQFEFILDKQCLSPEAMEDLAGFFESGGFVEFRDGGYSITPKGLRKLPLFSDLVCNVLESLWIALDALWTFKDTSFTKKDIVARMKSKGTRFLKRGGIQHPSALSAPAFANALKLFEHWGILEVDRSFGEDVLTVTGEQGEWEETEQRIKAFCHARSLV